MKQTKQNTIDKLKKENSHLMEVATDRLNRIHELKKELEELTKRNAEFRLAEIKRTEKYGYMMGRRDAYIQKLKTIIECMVNVGKSVPSMPSDSSLEWDCDSGANTLMKTMFDKFKKDGLS